MPPRTLAALALALLAAASAAPVAHASPTDCAPAPSRLNEDALRLAGGAVGWTWGAVLHGHLDPSPDRDARAYALQEASAAPDRVWCASDALLDALAPFVPTVPGGGEVDELVGPIYDRLCRDVLHPVWQCGA